MKVLLEPRSREENFEKLWWEGRVWNNTCILIRVRQRERRTAGKTKKEKRFKYLPEPRLTRVREVKVYCQIIQLQILIMIQVMPMITIEWVSMLMITMNLLMINRYFAKQQGVRGRRRKVRFRSKRPNSRTRQVWKDRRKNLLRFCRNCK